MLFRVKILKHVKAKDREVITCFKLSLQDVVTTLNAKMDKDDKVRIIVHESGSERQLTKSERDQLRSMLKGSRNT